MSTNCTQACKPSEPMKVTARKPPEPKMVTARKPPEPKEATDRNLQSLAGKVGCAMEHMVCLMQFDASM